MHATFIKQISESNEIFMRCISREHSCNKEAVGPPSYPSDFFLNFRYDILGHTSIN